jgi:uncharacterized protein (DUF362 family)
MRRTRRDFLRQAAAFGGMLALGPTRVLGQDAGQDGKAAEAPAEMAIARWDAAAVDPGLAEVARRLTEQALEAVGGLGRFVSRGDVVWIKPNLGWNRPPELAATTNPDVVATLVRLCLEAGAKRVRVGDYTCHDARQSYVTSGVAAAVREAGGEVVYLEERRFRDVELGGRRLKSWPVYPEILEADFLLNVPVVKHHSSSRVTACMKNYMGVVGGRRSAWHQDLPTCLCDITAFLKPRLCVVDALRILVAHGPTGGNPADVRELRTVAAGTDIVALDAFAAELLGQRPESLATARAGELTVT